MARRAKPGNPSELRERLIELLVNFERHLQSSELREQVQNLVPANFLLRDLGCSLLPNATQMSARQRILAYLRKYPSQIVDGDELMIVAGISEYARRVRELRVQEGWPILSGMTLRDLRRADQEDEFDVGDIPDMHPDQYMLVDDEQDRDAAHRWHLANKIRRSSASVKDKLLLYFQENVGESVTSEELRYVAGNVSEWARRTRELRTEEGWPVVTRNTGNPTLPIGVYVLERNEQAPPHDRHIPELVRREVMRRDNWVCQWKECGWPLNYPENDHRFLEVHHIEYHAEGGANDPENLVTLCNLHHDETHRTGKLNLN